MFIFSIKFFVLTTQRYADYQTKETFAFIFSKSNEDKSKIIPIRLPVYQGVAKSLSQIKSISSYELQEPCF